MHLADLKQDKTVSAVKVSIIIPVFNEQENVEPLAQKIYAVVKNLPEKMKLSLLMTAALTKLYFAY